MTKRSAAAISGPGRIANLPTGDAGHVVHAIDLLDAEALHQPVLDHLARRRRRLPRPAGRSRSAVPSKLRVSARYFAAPSSIAVCPSWPQACILPGIRRAVRQLRSVSSIGSASMSARSPIDLAARAVALPAMTPTTPVLPMPVTTSSQPKALSLSATIAGGPVHVEQDFGMRVDVAAPGGDLRLHVGDAVDDGHGKAPWRAAGGSLRDDSRPR